MQFYTEEEYRAWAIENMTENDVSARIGDILLYLYKFEEEITESMARCFFAVSFQNDKIIIELCKESETIESYYGNTDGIETQIYKRQVLSIDATAEDYINMLTSFIMNKDEYIYLNGERRVNSLHFLSIKQ